MKRTQRVWIVEANYDHPHTTGWHPTVGIALTKKEVEQVARNWRQRNPDDMFRVRLYVASLKL